MEIQGKYLKAASMFMGKNDLRSYLNGVYAEVSYDQLILTATDGRRMVSIRLDVEPGQRTTKFIIPASLLKDVKPKLTAYLSISDDDKLITLKQEDWAKQSAPIEEVFPEYRRVIPQKISGEAANYNPQYLLDAAKAVNMLTGQATMSLAISHNGSDAGVVEINDSNVILLIMPVRNKAEFAYVKPSW